MAENKEEQERQTKKQALSHAKQYFGLSRGEEALLCLTEKLPLPPELEYFNGFFERHKHLPPDHPVSQLIARAKSSGEEKFLRALYAVSHD